MDILDLCTRCKLEVSVHAKKCLSGRMTFSMYGCQIARRHAGTQAVKRRSSSRRLIWKRHGQGCRDVYLCIFGRVL